MIRVPVRSKMIHQQLRWKSIYSSDYIRSSFIDYFVNKHGHKYVKSSPVVPLCDPTVPFVNAGMNQFKGVFLGKVDAPYPKVVNSQKCIRVGGKHNDLDVVGTDGHHHTFFEMLGNWSFGDYYKKESCAMAWDLLLGPYRLKPENLVVTYFAGDVIIGLKEDTECRDIWRSIGVPDSRLKACGAKDNFWEMGATGPCGPSTEIHYVNPDGTLTEIWNLVFIQCNREDDGKVRGLRRQHVDTGLGLERLATLLQGERSNYHIDLFQPLTTAIHQNSRGVPPFEGKYGSDAVLDCAYRRLADHARMISVSLADGVFPASSINLKQIMRKSFKISSEVFQNPQLLTILYDQVVETLGSTYPELVSKEKSSKLIIEHERQAYYRMKADLDKKWKNLAKQYPEVEELSDVETSGFVQGYKEFKETMSKVNSNVVPGQLVFKLYDTHGFQEDVLDRIARLNHMELDKTGFKKLLSDHKARHKTALKEQASNRHLLFDQAIQKLITSGIRSTNDQHKYYYASSGNQIHLKPVKTKLAAILNEDCEWIDFLDPCEDRTYYLVAEDTNFYCEEGGQVADSGVIRVNDNVTFLVDTVFKIRDFVFHKGRFSIKEGSEKNYLNYQSNVVMELDVVKRLNVMRNHTSVHLLNAAITRVLPNSVVCPIGSSATDKGLSLNLSVYGEKLSEGVVLAAQDLIRESIKCDAPIETRVADSLKASLEDGLVTVPGETYPEVGLRVVEAAAPLVSKELCCGTHVPSTGFVQDFCVVTVKGAGSHTPTIHAITGSRAKEARELFCRAQKMEEVIDLVSEERREEEIASIKQQLKVLCGAAGAPYGDHARCLRLLEDLQKKHLSNNELELQAIAQAEIRDAFSAAKTDARRFVVHFVRCSYLMEEKSLSRALKAGAVPSSGPVMLLGCGGGHLRAVCGVPQGVVNEQFSAERWLRCVAAVFRAGLAPPTNYRPDNFAEMEDVKVSLINCEQLVQDAMRIAIKYAQAHVKESPNRNLDSDDSATKNRRQN